MSQQHLLERSGRRVDPAAIADFAAGLAGRAILPEDPGYDLARSIWNAAIDRRPGLIVRCRGVADVIRAVRFARDNDLLVAVRGGGHNVAGRALCDDGIVIDLSDMRAVVVDPETATVRVQGGATLGDVDRETHLHGLAVPLGVVSKTGVAGLTLGGGVGWLVRKHGLSCDNVSCFELVTADGGVVSTSADEHPDLFWALRGGGGNFGIVTCFTFRAHPVSTVLGGLIVHPRERAGELLRFYRDFMASAPEELAVYCAFVTTPDGVPAVAAIACWCGETAEGERVLEPLRAFGPPMLDAVQPMPFPEMQRILDGAFPDGTYNHWKASFVPKLGDELIDVLVEHANRMRSPLSALIDRVLRRRPRTGGPEQVRLRAARLGVQHRLHRAVDRSGRDRAACRLGPRRLRRRRPLLERQPPPELPERGRRRGGPGRLRRQLRAARRGEAQVRSDQLLLPQREHRSGSIRATSQWHLNSRSRAISPAVLRRGSGRSR